MEQRIDQNAPETDLRNVPMDIISVNSSEVDSESSGGDESSDGKGDDTSSSFQRELCLLEQKEVEARTEERGHVTRWKTKQGILRVEGAASTVEESPATVSREYEEVLRDI